MKIARNILAGALSGLGLVVLLQQYAVLYPTGMVVIIGVVVGIAVQFGIGALFGTGRRAEPAIAASAPDAYASTAYTTQTNASDTGYGGSVDASDPMIADQPTYDARSAAAPADWVPTHRIPGDGLATWPDRDPTLEQGPRLEAGLGVRVDYVGDGWAHIVCENGWAAWVDAGRLEAWQ